MDDARQIISELLAKLAELDGKVASYQQDIHAEFERYRASLLKDVPEHISDEVSRVITESMPNYPMLSGPSSNRDSVESPAAPTPSERGGAWGGSSGRKSPPPILYHTSGIPKDGPRSPHEREKEFQGVFTPSYLPLLDGSDQAPPQSPSESPPSASPPAHSPSRALGPSLDGILSVDETLEPGVGLDAPRPVPIRRQTDGTESSAGSSGSDTKVRRSALRRSSSSVKDSPRRVRFDVQGAEVLPTASPQASVSSLDVCLTEEAGVSTSAVVDDSPLYSGPSLLDIEGEEDLLPQPKKVSSTQALRALTRSPLEEGTVWRVVNPDPEELNPKMNGLDETTVSAGPGPATTAAAAMATTSTTTSPSKAKSPSPLRQRVVVVEQPPQPAAVESSPDGQDKEGSDEDFLSMRSKTTKKPSSPVLRSPVAGSPRATAGHHVSFRLEPKIASPKSSTGGDTDDVGSKDTQDGFFDFDDGEDTLLGASARPRSTEKYLPEDEDAEPEAEQETKRPVNPLAAHSTSQYTTLPARTVSTRSPDARSMTPPTSSRFLQGSVGSYKGQSLRVSAVLNPKLQEAAEAMGDFTTIVGSIHDRNSYEDLGSFGANTAASFTGAPRSFSERMAMEEAMEKTGD